VNEKPLNLGIQGFFYAKMQSEFASCSVIRVTNEWHEFFLAYGTHIWFLKKASFNLSMATSKDSLALRQALAPWPAKWPIPCWQYI
jgi:hypothetical protein